MAVGGGSRSGRAAEPFPSAVGQPGPQGDPTRPGSHPCVPWPRLSLEQRGLPVLQLWSLVPEPFCTGSGEICRAPGVLAGSIEDCQLHHSD